MDMYLLYSSDKKTDPSLGLKEKIHMYLTFYSNGERKTR